MICGHFLIGLYLLTFRGAPHSFVDASVKVLIFGLNKEELPLLELQSLASVLSVMLSNSLVMLGEIVLD